MLLQKQPSKFTCLATAFAMILGHRVQEIMDLTGHDGSEIWFPKKEVPQRGHHPQELIQVSLSLGWSATSVWANPCTEDIPIFTEEQNSNRMHYFMSHYNGVVLGQGHAIALFENKFYDPANAKECSLEGFGIKEFIILQPL